jgi:hypothetical protein
MQLKTGVRYRIIFRVPESDWRGSVVSRESWDSDEVEGLSFRFPALFAARDEEVESSRVLDTRDGECAVPIVGRSSRLAMAGGSERIWSSEGMDGVSHLELEVEGMAVEVEDGSASVDRGWGAEARGG